jgi:imidazolonepropionase-like amidohydrolase
VYQLELADFEPTPADWHQYVTPLAVPNVLRFQRSIQLDNDSCLRRALAHQRTLIRMLHDRGGLVVTGTDAVIPVITPGWALHRELENLVEAGLTPLEAIRAGTLDAAAALGLADDRGSLAPGKRADLIVLADDPSDDIAAVGSTLIVFKDGRPYDPAALRASVVGMIGIP